MRAVSVDLSADFKEIEIVTIADAHIGDAHCDMGLIKQRVKYVKDTPNAFAILNGDLLNNATKTSVSDIYNERMPPMKQLERAGEIFSPIKTKILGVTGGNHEFRTFKFDGIDLTKLICRELNIEDVYSEGAILIFVRFGQVRDGRKESNGSGEVRKMCYSIYANHGSGGGRKEGAKAIRLADMASIIDADVYIHSHTHLPFVMKQAFFRVDPRNSSYRPVDKLFVNSAAYLDYAGYSEVQEYKPTSKDNPRIFLSGAERNMYAQL